MKPPVAVFLPTRNRAAMLGRCIESVLGQTHDNIELLVVDDASTDDTPDVIRRFAAHDQRVRGLSLPAAAGAPAARNLAIRSATAELITGIDDDDRMLPRRIETLVAAFDTRYSLVCSGFRRVSRAGTRTIGHSRKVISLDAQLMRNHIGNAALTLRSRIIEVGLFDESMPAWQDYDLWTRLILRFGPALRIAASDHLVHVDHDAPRISVRTLQGAARFGEKFRDLMSGDHLRAQALEVFMLEGRQMSLNEFRRLVGRGSHARALRYLITSNFPWLRTLR